MSKTKSIRIAVVAAIVSLMLALAAWAVTVPAFAAGESTDTTLAMGRAWIPDNLDGSKGDKVRIALTPFAHVGAEGTGETDIANSTDMQEKIYLTVPGVTDVVNPSHIRTEPAYNALLLYFLNTDYSDIKNVPVNTTLTVKAGFGYTASDGNNYATTEDAVYTYMGNELWIVGQPHNMTLGTAWSAGQLFVSTTPFMHVGADNSGETDIANYGDMSSKIFITMPDESTLTPSHIRTERAPTNGLKLYFNSSGEYAATQKIPAGAVLTIKGGFEYIGNDGGLYRVTADVNYTCAGNGVWTTGEVKSITLNEVINHGQLLINFTPFAHVGAPESGETDISNYAAMKEFIEIVDPAGTKVNPSHIRTERVVPNARETAGFKLYFNDTEYANVNTVPTGSVLTVKAGFVYGAYDANAYKLENDFVRIYNGSAWVEKATDFELGLTEISIPQGAQFTPTVTFAPAGSYSVLEYSSSNTDVAEVTNGKLVAKAAGTTTISVKFSDTNTKTVSVTVTAAEKKIVIDNDRTFYVGEDETFDISKVKVKVHFGKGSDNVDYYGESYTLSTENAEFTQPTEAGEHSMAVNVTLGSGDDAVTGTVNVKLDVQECREMVISNLSSLFDNHVFSDTNLAVYFQGTFGNSANVNLFDLTDEQADSIADYITFVREGATVGVTVDKANQKTPNYLTHILVIPLNVNGAPLTAYEDGDTVTLKKGLSFYQWFGDKDEWNRPVGDGDYAKVGELKHDIRLIVKDRKFNWHIDPETGVVKEETVQVGIGKTHASNVAIVPEYATHGEWYFTVADNTVAKVNSQGLISALKIGTTKVEAELKDFDGNLVEKVEFNIEVVDIETGIEITSSAPIYITPGAALDIGALAENYGLKGVVIMASGAKGDEVDLTKAQRVTGYDPDKLGEQTITLRLTVNGTSVSGTFKLTVGDAPSDDEGCGCGSSVASVSSLLAGGGILAIAMLLTLRRRKSRA